MDKGKILLVDDVQLSRVMMGSMVEEMGSKVFTATNGIEAFEIIKKERPDVVLMDLYMPEMNGDECCRKIKEDPSLKDIPVIMVTSANNEEEMELCRMAGCDDILLKPYGKEDLFKKVNKHVGFVYREHSRIPVNLTTTYEFSGMKHSAKVADLSRGGMLLVSENLIPEGANIQFLLSLNDGEYEVNVVGKVVRFLNDKTCEISFKENESAMGIKFSELPQRLKWFISTKKG